MAFFNTKVAYLSLVILLITSHCVTCLIVPEELPTILSVIYSNIPPIKKGTDSRVGVGFRLGEHADFQVLLELGPQVSTDPIGNTSQTKAKRAAIMASALKGEMGPWAQAIATYQVEQKLKKYMSTHKIKSTQSTSKIITDTSKTIENQPESNDWLSKWSQGLATNPLEIETSQRKVNANTNRLRVVNNPSSDDNKTIEKAQNDLNILKKLFGNPTTTSVPTTTTHISSENTTSNAS